MTTPGRNDPCWCGSGAKYKKCHMAADAKNPPPVSTKPRRGKYIKTPDELAKMRLAGAFNGELMDYVRPFVKAGISTEEINTLVHEYTIRHGHIPATLGYQGFPKSCCVSINNVVCHGIPSPGEILKDGDIVNVDCTTIVDGYYGDSSETFYIGTVSDAARHLVEVTAHALIRGLDAVKPGALLSDIADAIDPYVQSQHCQVVRNYTGHGVGSKFHEHFTVYHHKEKDAEVVRLAPGMTFTIEPMINAGDWRITLDPVDKWTVRTKDGSLSAQFEHTVAVSETGVEILTLTPSQKKAGKPLIVNGLKL